MDSTYFIRAFYFLIFEGHQVSLVHTNVKIWCLCRSSTMDFAVVTSAAYISSARP